MKKGFRIGVGCALLLLVAGCATPTKVIEVPLFIRDGAVRIVLNGFPQWETMAALADVHHVRFDLAVLGVASQSQTLSFAQLTNGGASASVMFTDLYPRAATISVTAFDNATPSVALGTASATVNIATGVVSTVPITLQLN